MATERGGTASVQPEPSQILCRELNSNRETALESRKTSICAVRMKSQFFKVKTLPVCNAAFIPMELFTLAESRVT